MRKVIISFVFFVFSKFALSQPVEQMIKVIVAPDHENWLYSLKEEAKFDVTILKYGNPVKGCKIKYEVGPEKLDPIMRDSIVLPDGKTVIRGGSLQNPGFLRCAVTARVDGKEYRNIATVGFEPDKIKAFTELPKDFLQFWESGKKELSQTPIDAKMTLLPERSTEKVNVYHVSLQGLSQGMRIYGILSVPTKEGKHPALLKVPGGGVRGYYGDIATAEKGVITFEIGIHGVPVNLDPEVYLNLQSGALKSYHLYNLDDYTRYYYRRVYLGCVRANDFLTQLDEFDGVNLGVLGGSQGGALAIVTASLDSRVKYLASYYPALSDLTAYLNGRAGGWPHFFDKMNIKANGSPEKIKTSSYYDVVNFARFIKIPGHYAWGFNDEVCPPSSVYAAYNVIDATKAHFLSVDSGHWVYQEIHENMGGWIVKRLLERK